jgi:hypothetical protein
MLTPDFDRSAARAFDPPPKAPLISGVYNYCNRWCERCPFTDRCLVFRDTRDEDPPRDAGSLARRVRASLQRALEVIRVLARREPVDSEAIETDPASPAADHGDRHRADPLVVSARQYGDLAWRLARALGPIVAARGDPAVIDAVEVIDWYSSMIGAKTQRAVSSEAFAREPIGSEGAISPEDEASDVQTDFNGSAKVALQGIAESRRAWMVLMAEGKATADGVPAQAVRMLDELDTAVRARFPDAPAFVRPGFDDNGDKSGGRES